jgi:hypothetical protein
MHHLCAKSTTNLYCETCLSFLKFFVGNFSGKAAVSNPLKYRKASELLGFLMQRRKGEQ